MSHSLVSHVLWMVVAVTTLAFPNISFPREWLIFVDFVIGFKRSIRVVLVV